MIHIFRSGKRRHILQVAIFMGMILLVGIIFYQQSQTVSQTITELERKVALQEQRVASMSRAIDELVAGNETLEVALSEAQNQQAAAASDVTAKLSELETNFSENIDISSIVATWAPRVVRLRCSFSFGSDLKISGTASGVATYLAGKPYILTSKHVVDRTYTLDSCTATVPASDFSLTFLPKDISVADNRDLAFLSVSDVAAFTTVTKTEVPTCSARPAIGDSVVILGYPSVGSRDSITATEGIIAGFDDEYYVTSAKIEQGNSGGAAVLLSGNCFLGIPTLAKVGQLESLARILPF